MTRDWYATAFEKLIIDLRFLDIADTNPDYLYESLGFCTLKNILL